MTSRYREERRRDLEALARARARLDEEWARDLEVMEKIARYYGTLPATCLPTP